jgi:hypothetical protein
MSDPRQSEELNPNAVQSLKYGDNKPSFNPMIQCLREDSHFVNATIHQIDL